MSDETQCLTNDLLLFRVKVLEGVIPGAYDGQGDGEGIQQVLVLSEEKAYNLPECQCQACDWKVLYNMSSMIPS